MERNDSAFESVDIDYGDLEDEKRSPTPEPTVSRSPPKVKRFNKSRTHSCLKLICRLF